MRALNRVFKGRYPSAPPFNPRQLFRNLVVGAFYDPSDLSTLFQDAAGTIPVTASGQPVGRMLDKSGRGNHATQANAAQRPTYRRGDHRGVVNLLKYSEQFDNAAWNKATSNATAAPVVAPNYATAPDGTLTAERVTLTLPGDPEWALVRVLNTAVSLAAGEAFTDSLWLRATDASQVGKKVSLYAYNSTAGVYGSILNVTLSLSWARVEVRQAFVAASTAQEFSIGKARSNAPGQGGTTGIADTNTATDFLIWGAQREKSSVATSYQRNDSHLGGVATGLGSDLHWRELDGVDDHTASSAGGGGSAGFFFCQAIVPTGGNLANRTLWSDAGTNTGYRVRINSANKLELAAGNGTAFTVVATTETLQLSKGYLVTAWDDGVNLNVQLDGGAIASIARPAVVAGTAGFTQGKNNTAASDYFAGFSHAGIYRKDGGLSDFERTQAKAYCKRMAGL